MNICQNSLKCFLHHYGFGKGSYQRADMNNQVTLIELGQSKWFVKQNIFSRHLSKIYTFI